jgi:hypothetical protein
MAEKYFAAGMGAGIRGAIDIFTVSILSPLSEVSLFHFYHLFHF